MNLWAALKRLLSSPSPPSVGVDLGAFQRLIGYEFRDLSLLALSLTHRSVARTSGNHQPSNERLEFLGDSVLGLVIAERLYSDRPLATEGDLTKLKAMLVNESALSQVAIEVGINRFVFMSPEEERSGGRERPSIISDAFEAVIGAVFIDGGLEEARRLVLELIYSRKDSIISDSSQQNYKGDLLELIQGRGEGMPLYEIASEIGPDHDKTFHVVVSLNGTRLGDGVGSSKKEAEQRAACMALEKLSGR
jgi:ribonuclease III